MKLEDFLSSDAYTPVNKALARYLWFVCAWFLWELIRQRARFGSPEFYFSQEDMEKEIGISAKVQRSCIRILVEKWYLSVDKHWAPCRNWYKINDCAILNCYSFDESGGQTRCAQTAQLDVPKGNNLMCPNGTTYNNKETNKENKKESELSLSELEAALEEFEEMRKKIKKPLTSSAKNRLLARLDNLAKSDEEKVAILNQSVDHCRQDIYELKKPINTEPQSNIEWAQFFNKCYEEWTHKEKILEKYGREKYEKIKNLWVWRCVTGTVDDSFKL